MALTVDAVNELAAKLNTVVDDAAQLYYGNDEIPEELADALGTLWEMCADFVNLYEDGSREGTKNAPGELFWFSGTDTPTSI